MKLNITVFQLNRFPGKEVNSSDLATDGRLAYIFHLFSSQANRPGKLP